MSQEIIEKIRKGIEEKGKSQITYFEEKQLERIGITIEGLCLKNKWSFEDHCQKGVIKIFKGLSDISEIVPITNQIITYRMPGGGEYEYEHGEVPKGWEDIAPIKNEQEQIDVKTGTVHKLEIEVGVTFGLALEAMKKGLKVTRKEWGRTEYLLLRNGRIYSEDGYFNMDQEHILAEDWEVIEKADPDDVPENEEKTILPSEEYLSNTLR